MPSSILNSDDGVISGTSGLKSSGGDDGNLVFQSKGTETARINTDKQIVAAAGTASLPALTTTGDVNTGIFFPAADTIAFAEGGAEAMRIDSSANLQFNSGYGSVATAFGCRAWVNFDGTNTVAIRASGNVSSITDGGTGDYTINFTVAMPNTNYAWSLAASDSASGFGIVTMRSVTAPTTSALRIKTTDNSNNFADNSYICAAIFR